MAYLDHNATTQPREEVLRAVHAAMAEEWGNPSSVHRAGQSARRAVELARAALADLIRAKPRELTFTSGGTESVDLAIRGLIGAFRPAADAAEGPPVLITDAVEHAAVRDLAEGLEKSGAAKIRQIPLLSGGLVDASAIPPLLEDGWAAVVSVQWANNETGVIQPVDAIGEACRAAGVPFHCDATQWIGKEPVEQAVSAFCDLMTFSPHKFHGPKGIGVLWVRRGIRLRPTMHGSQELGRRGGTENTPGIMGAGEAAQAATAWLAEPSERTRLGRLRDEFESRVVEGACGAGIEAIAHGTEHPRLWNTTNIGFKGLEAEALLLMLSERGVYASAGAACSSGSLEPSPVLLAMGIEPAVAHGSLRFSLGRDTTEEDLQRAAATVIECVSTLSRVTAV